MNTANGYPDQYSIDQDRQRIARMSLVLKGLWFDEGRWFAKWCPKSGCIQRTALNLLRHDLKPALSRRCKHLKGHGGVKGTVRYLNQIVDRYAYVARFDVVSYYESMDHGLILKSLRKAGIGGDLERIVADYLVLPDKPDTGKAMVAGGALSPILGGLYLNPLDQIMGQDKRIVYVRYMDDFVVLAKTRWHLKKAIAQIFKITTDLKLRLHRKIKCFIGRTANGFDFLGYTIHPQRRLRSSSVSLQRLVARARRLRAKEAVKIASGSTSPTGTDGCTEDLKDQSHAKEGYDVITYTS
jgi:RNA-directed DNA polymerase